MQYSAILIAVFLWTACQGPEGLMGPASSPKTAAEQAADTTGCAVTINVTGEQVIYQYQGDNPDTATVTVYDTITVAEGGSSLGDQFAFITIGLHANLGSVTSRSWTIESDGISESTVKEVLLRRNRISTDDVDVSTSYDDVGGYNWMQFDAWADLFTPPLQTKPSYEISAGQIVISDPNGVIRYGTYLGILLGS